ncbi:type II toxin-antitoxin system PemK/MazF family toxin [Microbacterium sp. 179-I 3D4 NHS]|uniref:type II toxin-antitoxin system PemK/MazF family toxin n=1 Tax=Microbacterium sp. 179-I 3D4 NHS TaxID=3142381 RepID=UPI0039A21102
MSSSRSILATIARTLLGTLTSRTTRTSRTPQEPGRSGVRAKSGAPAGPAPVRDVRTVRLAPDPLPHLRISYAPAQDGAPDAGEIVWTWVPYEEGDGRGKDRPVLVIGRESTDRVFAVRMTSRSHDGDRDYLSIGTGDWDSQRRESWVDIEQLYSVHVRGMRREAAALPRARFDRVAGALQKRYGWATAR